jgi:hypothetical protein
LYSLVELFNTILDVFTLPSALLSACSFGTTLIFANKSPATTSSPSSTKISSIIPLIWGTILTSSSGTTLPVATIFSSIVCLERVVVSKVIADLLFV